MTPAQRFNKIRTQDRLWDKGVHDNLEYAIRPFRRITECK